ncbi:MAG: Rrf2 family transcriptional regulator [Kiritimatiellaceae bacterium]|nr:Rrf2 family transcriptional regulator [Kiritimatiellaceae bacterium]
MKLSTKGRYAARIMHCIARLQADGPVPKKRIAEQEGISTDYIEQIIVPLKNAGLVVSTRGLRGGFALAKGAGDISLYDVLSATEGDFNRVEMLMEGESRSDERVMQGIWQGAFQELQHYFAGISLEKLVDDYARLTDVEPIMFNI